MAEKRKLETAETTIRTAYSKFGVFNWLVGILAVVVAIVGLVIMLIPEKTEVTAQILSCGELTKYSPIAELKGHFTYAGEDVAHLWKLTVQLVNSGGKTIVGEGNQKNIIGEGLNFVFPDDTRILNIEEEANTFQSTITQPEPTQIQIQFRQWRSGEYSITCFYVASDKPLDADPLPTTPIIRDIIDGDVVIEDLTETRPEERISLIDHLPRPLSLAGKIMGGIIAGGLTLLFIFLLVKAWMDTIKKFRWKRQYLSDFRIYLNQVEPQISKRRKKLYRETPEELPDELWTKFKGKKASWSLYFDDKTMATIITILLVLGIFGFSSLILMLLPV